MYHAYMGFLFIYTHTCTHMYIQTLQSLENLSFLQKDKNRAEENVLPTSYDKSTTTFPIFQDYPWAMKMMEKTIQGCSRTPGQGVKGSVLQPQITKKSHISQAASNLIFQSKLLQLLKPEDSRGFFFQMITIHQ